MVTPGILCIIPELNIKKSKHCLVNNDVIVYISKTPAQSGRNIM